MLQRWMFGPELGGVFAINVGALNGTDLFQWPTLVLLYF